MCPCILHVHVGLQSVQDVKYPSHHNWKESKYLMSRKSELKDVIQDIGFSPSTVSIILYLYFIHLSLSGTINDSCNGPIP